MTDKKRPEHRGCRAIMGSLTNAQKAQKALASAAIPSNINKIDSSETRKGCVWSVNFSCNQLQNVQNVLASAGIHVKEWGGVDAK